MYSGIRLGTLLGLVFLPHVRCSGNIVDGTAGRSLNFKYNMGNSARPQQTLGQVFFQNPQNLTPSSYSISFSQGTHSSLVAPGLSQPLPPYKRVSSYQMSSPSKNIWPSSSSATLFKMADSGYSMHGLQYGSGSEHMKPYRSESRSNIAKPSIVSSAEIILRPETGGSQDFVDPNNPGVGKQLPVYSTVSRPSPYRSQISHKSGNIWPGTTASNSFQSDVLHSSSAEVILSKPQFRPKKPFSHFTPAHHFTASSGAIHLVNAVNPSASDGRVLTSFRSQSVPGPKEMGSSSAIGYGFESGYHDQESHGNGFQASFKPASMYPVQMSKHAEQTHFGTLAKHMSQPIGSKASGIQDGTWISKCTIDIPSHYGQGSIRRCALLSSNPDLLQNQGSTNSTLTTWMLLFSQKKPTRSSVIVPDETLQPIAVQNANPSMMSSHDKFGNRAQTLQSQDIFQGVNMFSSRTNAQGPARRVSVPALPSGGNVYLPRVGSPQSNIHKRCEMHGSAPPAGSSVPLAWNRGKSFKS